MNREFVGDLLKRIVAVVVLAVLLQMPVIAGRPSGPDLDVTYIELVRPDGSRWSIDGPNGGWPLLGEPVVWRGHIRNSGDRTSGPFTYAWEIDGQVVDSGERPGLNVGDEAILTLSWTWPISTTSDGRILQRRALRLAVEHRGPEPEISLTNNALQEVIGALAVGFWVEQSVYNYYNERQYVNCLGRPCEGSNSWEDWAQRNLRHWNEMLASASPPIPDRVRLDKVVVVPDGALPLTPIPEGKPTNTPDASDRTVDIMWGFPARDLADEYFQLLIQDWDPGLVHELSHARGLPDQYGLNVHRSRDVIEVLDDKGRPAWDYFPDNDLVYTAKYEDAMSNPRAGFFGLYSAYALNSLAGQRNQGINYNPPHDDEFRSPPESWRFLLVTSNLPRENRLRLLDDAGRPLAGAMVRVYQMSSPRNGVWYAKCWDGVADIVGVTGEDGMISLGANPFGPSFFTGSLYCAHDCIGQDNWLLLVSVSYRGRTEFHFLEYTDFNLAYWRGQHEMAIYDVQTTFRQFESYFPLILGYSGR